MSYKDYLVNYSNTDLPELYSDWLWLINADDLIQPSAMSAFGDLFFLKENGEVFLLDTLEGTAEHFASSREDMERQLSSPENRNNYLFSDLVTTLREKGVILSDNQLYLFKVHPLVGGQAMSDNVEVASMRVALSLTGQLHRQIKQQH